MSHVPLISIIIPCYNAERWIWEAIDSCVKQSYSNREVVVVDDGSTDNSPNIIQQLEFQYPNIVKYIIKPNGGSSSARNLGVKASCGDFFLFLDGDDLLTADAIEILVNAVCSQNTDAAVGNWVNFSDDDPSKEQTHSSAFHYSSDSLASILKARPVISTFMVRRNTHLWNEGMVVWEAFDYFLALLAQGWSIVHVDHVVTKIRQHRSPERITVKHDHFEPYITGTYFANYKAELNQKNMLTLRRCEVLDLTIFYSIIPLVQQHEFAKAEELLKRVSWQQITQYEWFKWVGLPGFAKSFGGIKGIQLYLQLRNLVVLKHVERPSE